MTQQDNTRADFDAKLKHLDISKTKDAWGNQKYVCDHVESIWYGWQAAIEHNRKQNGGLVAGYPNTKISQATPLHGPHGTIVYTADGNKAQPAEPVKAGQPNQNEPSEAEMIASLKNLHTDPELLDRLTKAAQPGDALKLADELESLILEVANGERAAFQLPIEPFVRAYKTIRTLAASVAAQPDTGIPASEGNQQLTAIQDALEILQQEYVDAAEERDFLRSCLALQDADRVYAVADMVHAMFRSGNSVPVSRVTITREQYEAAIVSEL